MQLKKKWFTLFLIINSYYKKFTSGIFLDFGLNIFASLIITFTTQIIVYPYLSRIMSEAEYGLLLTVMGIVTAVGVALGNPLNNTRILMQNHYDKKKTVGDYNILFIGCLIANTFIVYFLLSTILQNETSLTIGCTFVSILVLFRAYFSVSYRLIINYKKILVISIVGFIGYMFGLIVTVYTKEWIYTFLFGELFSCVFIFFTGFTLKEPFKITNMFKLSLKKFLYLMFGAVLTTIIVYMDRFFIYPILGPSQVAIFIVASFLGKMAGILMTPIAGVLLTYYAKEASLSLQSFYKRITSYVILSLIFYIFIMLIGYQVTEILYPTIYESAKPYIALANIGSTLFVLSNTIQPTLLKFCHAKWQIYIQSIFFLCYVVFGFYGMKESGLLGFCYAVIAANLVRVILMIAVIINSLKQKREF